MRAPVNAVARFRPWPAGGGAVASGCPLSLASAPAASPTTAFVFSVFRDRASSAAMACSASFSLS